MLAVQQPGSTTNRVIAVHRVMQTFTVCQQRCVCPGAVSERVPLINACRFFKLICCFCLALSSDRPCDDDPGQRDQPICTRITPSSGQAQLDPIVALAGRLCTQPSGPLAG